MSTTTQDVLLSDENQFNEHTPLPWKAHDMEHRTIVKKNERGEGVAIAETAPATNDFHADIEAEATRDFIVHACNTYYALQAEHTKLLDLIQQGVEAVSEIHRINKDLARRGPDTAAKLCEKLSATYLSAVKEELPNL